MRILIAYTTKSGTTRDCAHMLADYFSVHEVMFADLDREMPDPREYDAVIIGSPVRMGKISASARRYLQEKGKEISERPFGIYICCGFCDNADDYIGKNLPAELVEQAAVVLPFGGESRLAMQKGFDKLIMRLVLSHIASNNRNEDRERDIPYPALLPENIRRFADEMKRNF